jgi:epoxide hydrolase-like predicted phosphatase
MKRIEWLLFDLGNVLIEVEQSRIFEGLATFTGRQVDEIKAALMADKLFWQRFIVEEFSPAQLTQVVNALLNEELGHEQVVDAFNAEFGKTIQTTADLIPMLRRKVSVGCLSNTNSIHWDHMLRSYDWMQHFDRRFASQLVGYAKPDPEIYSRVAGQLGVRPDQILFFDDKAENITTAERLGWNAKVYRNHSELVGQLREFEL